jgi:O-antigen/teichoic acid export membrane protein
MMRATVLATIDQALLSLLNFALAMALIRFANKEEYGLYAQLMTLQSFFSPVHAGLFVSAYLALAPRMSSARALAYRNSMALADIWISLGSAILVALLTFFGARLFGGPLSWATVAAATAALVGLWWREFLRQTYFAGLQYRKALYVDVVYAVTTAIALALLILNGTVNATTALWCMVAGAGVAAVLPVISMALASRASLGEIRADVAASWGVGRWDALGSCVTWASSQSYVYFAAAFGGLSAAADVSVGRLLATPLLLLWSSYANVLRPNGVRAMADESAVTVRRLARRSLLFVMCCSAAYAAVLILMLPFAEHGFFGNKFAHLQLIALLWVAYSMLSGLTTVAASLLRSALRFRQVFALQSLCSVAALVLLALSRSLPGAAAQVLALALAEVISVALLWQALSQLIRTKAFPEHAAASP